MIEKEFVPIERILDNLLVMQSDELADIIEIMEKFYNDIRWLDTELFELWNERICFLVIIRVITGKFFFLYCIKNVDRDMNNFSFNTAVARLMEFVTAIYKYDGIDGRRSRTREQPIIACHYR